MYIIWNNLRYEIKDRKEIGAMVRFGGVNPVLENGAELTGTIYTYGEDDTLLWEDIIDESTHVGNFGKTITLRHNRAIPTTPSAKRQRAYAYGNVGTTDWHIEYAGKSHTCDALSQLGMRYEFREETAAAEEIRTLVEAKVEEIRAAYPDEN